jgi:hypothetical protein
LLHLHFAATLRLLFPFAVSREFLSLDHLLVCFDWARVKRAHLDMMIQVSLQYNRGLSNCLLRFQYVQIVRVLLLAQVPTLYLLLARHQQLQPVLLLRVNEHAYDWDAQEKNLKGGGELSARDHLSEEKDEVGPREDPREDLNNRLGCLVVKGAVVHIGQEREAR